MSSVSFYPDEKAIPNSLLYQYWELLIKYLKPQMSKVSILAFLLLSGIGLQLINPQVIRYFLDSAQSRGPQEALLFAAGLYITFALVQQLLSIATIYIGENISWAATNGLRADITLHCLRLDMSFHKRHSPGELIERIDGDITALANFFSRFIINVLGYSLLVAGILILLFREDFWVGLGLCLYTVVMLIIPGVLQSRAVALWSAARQAAAEQYGFLEERIAGAEDIRASGAEAYMLHRLYHHMRAMLEKTRSAFLVESLIFNITNLLIAIGYAIGLALGVFLYTQGQASIGTAYLIVYYIGMLSVPLQNIREQVQDFQQAAASIQRIREFIQIQPLVKDPQPTPNSSIPRLPPGAFSVEFREVSFHYDENENVLEDINFCLQPGRRLGVLGRTGSGKTTLTRLLFRLYDPSGGAILLNGSDIRSASISDLRARVGLVTQDVQLFQATIRENLAFFNKEISDGDIVFALQELGLWDWLQSHSQGLDTRLLTGGQGLSAGEAQLLAFTRIFLKDPGLVILDEASSRLDPATETLLEHAIDRLFRQRTGMIIAHRLRTVQRADDILILDKGRVIEYGPRLLLANNPSSHFHHLLRTGLEEALV